MKRGLLLFCCLLFGTLSAALAQQGLRVSVLNDAKEPLPHAYIYVNERAVAVADTSGWAVIPLEKLQLGDTISVSYVATEGQSVVFDQNLSIEGKYHFILPEIYGYLQAETVVIKADFDIDKHYRKYVKERDSYKHESIWVSHFLVGINSTDNSRPSASVDGYLKIGVKYPNFANDLPLGITTLDDTTGLSSTIEYHLRSALNNNLTALQLTKDPEHFGIKGIFNYLGQDEHYRIYRITYPSLISAGSYQILLKSDIESGNIREIIVEIVNLYDGSTTYSKSTIREMKRGLSVRYVPSQIEYRFKYNNRTGVDITLDNIDLKHYRWDLPFMVAQFTDEVKEFGALLGLRSEMLRVSVRNDIEEPMPHAYIYVNERAVAVTDTSGWASISTDNIKLGDIISVSYIACEDQSVIFVQDMLIGGEYQFVMPEIHGILQADAVVVKAKVKRLYHKELPILRHIPYVNDGQYSTNFAMNITNPGDSVPSYWIDGRLRGLYTPTMALNRDQNAWLYLTATVPSLNPDPTVLNSLQRRGASVGFVNDLPLEITTSDDTTGLSHALKYFLPRALQANHLSLLRVYDPEPDEKELKIHPQAKVNYDYIDKVQDPSFDALARAYAFMSAFNSKEKGSYSNSKITARYLNKHRTFRLTYSGYGVGTISKIEVTSDVEDKNNHKVVKTSHSFLDMNNNNSYYVKAKIQAKMIGEKEWTVPTELAYSIKESDGTVVNITMSNIVLSNR